MSNQYYHQPILVEPILEALKLRPDAVIVDVTCGEGGHSSRIAPLIPQGHLICMDRDERILSVARERLSEYSNITFVYRTFDEIAASIEELGFLGVDGILADFGISMFHLKQKGLGLSYTDEESLDMRLGYDNEISAEQIINTFAEKKIADIIYEYGEERNSRRIAHEIVSVRPIFSGKKLAEVVFRAFRGKKIGRIHPATRTFQALRIFVNKELEKIESFLPQAVDILNEGARLCVMSFHSLEDRIVKHRFKDFKANELGKILTKKPIIPDFEEINKNPASRSTKLRIFEKRILGW